GEHADLHPGRSAPAGAGGGGGRDLHRRDGSRAGVLEPGRADGGAVRGGSLCERARRADVPDRGSGTLAVGWDGRVLGPERLPGEGAWLPGGAWRDRGPAAGGGWSPRGGGFGAGG